MLLHVCNGLKIWRCKKMFSVFNNFSYTCFCCWIIHYSFETFVDSYKHMWHLLQYHTAFILSLSLAHTMLVTGHIHTHSLANFWHLDASKCIMWQNMCWKLQLYLSWTLRMHIWTILGKTNICAGDQGFGVVCQISNSFSFLLSNSFCKSLFVSTM